MIGRHRFFPGSWRDHPFRKGDLKYVVLSLIQDKPRYGYEIIRALEERSHGFYAPSPGAVYPTLQMLEEMGYVHYDLQDNKKVYTITDEGIKFLDEQEPSAERIRLHMKERWHPRDIEGIGETMQEFGRLGELLVQHGRQLGSDKMKQVREAISRAYNEIKDITGE